MYFPFLTEGSRWKVIDPLSALPNGRLMEGSSLSASFGSRRKRMYWVSSLSDCAKWVVAPISCDCGSSTCFFLVVIMVREFSKAIRAKRLVG